MRWNITTREYPLRLQSLSSVESATWQTLGHPGGKEDLNTQSICTKKSTENHMGILGSIEHSARHWTILNKIANITKLLCCLGSALLWLLLSKLSSLWEDPHHHNSPQWLWWLWQVAHTADHALPNKLAPHGSGFETQLTPPLALTDGPQWHGHNKKLCASLFAALVQQLARYTHHPHLGDLSQNIPVWQGFTCDCHIGSLATLRCEWNGVGWGAGICTRAGCSSSTWLTWPFIWTECQGSHGAGGMLWGGDDRRSQVSQSHRHKRTSAPTPYAHCKWSKSTQSAETKDFSK